MTICLSGQFRYISLDLPQSGATGLDRLRVGFGGAAVQHSPTLELPISRSLRLEGG